MDTDIQSIEKTFPNKLFLVISVTLILVVIIITTTFLIFFNLFKSDQNKILANTYLSYNKKLISISKTSNKAALKSLKTSTQDYLATNIIFINGKTNIKTTLKDIGIKINMKDLENHIKNNVYSNSFFNYITQKINSSKLTIKFEENPSW